MNFYTQNESEEMIERKNKMNAHANDFSGIVVLDFVLMDEKRMQESPSNLLRMKSSLGFNFIHKTTTKQK